MANYANLEAAIQAAIYENNTNDITGAALQTVLLQMVSDMGKSGMLCNGVCDGNTVPPVAPDSNIFYIAPTGTYANFGGLTVAAGEWAIFIYNGGWQKQSVPVVTTDAVPTTGSTNPVQSGGVADALDTKADIDGYYSSLTAGTAENLVGRGTVLAEYTRRTSGGSADIGTGAATITKVHGNTIAWNQLIQTNWFPTGGSNGITWTNNGDGSYTINGTATGTVNLYGFTTRISWSDHKYFLSVSDSNIGFFFDGNPTNAGATNVATQVITALSANTYRPCLRILSGASFTNKKVYVRIHDITLMGVPSLTASEFESLFPLDYYAYNTGSLVSLTGTGIETNGFNQWDEEWESGYYDANGVKQADPTNIRSKNYIPIFPSTDYYFNIPSATSIRVCYYDAEKNFLQRTSTLVAGIYTTLANAAYMTFYMSTTYGTTYNHDICINLSWSGYRNGEYEAYWQRNLSLPITSVTSGGSAVFADGMKGVGSVYDELTSTKAVKRFAMVDMGTLTWSAYTSDSTGHSFVCNTKSDAKTVSNNNTVANIKTVYTTIDFNDISVWTTKDKAICQVTGGSPNRWIIRDTAYSNAATFTTAMNGVYLVYELATPTEYTLDSELNLGYSVDDFGTEEEVPQNTSTPSTAPIIYDVKYAMNAVDTLRNLPTNYISKDSLKNLLDTMQSAGIFSAYTMTYNAGTEQYTFTITV